MSPDTSSSLSIHTLPNSAYVVQLPAGSLLVHSPPETLKGLLARGISVPEAILLPQDIPPGQQMGSSGFVRQGVNYASVEFLLYANFFGKQRRTRLITPTQAQAERLYIMLAESIGGLSRPAGQKSLPWLERECAAVGYYPPLGRALQVEDLAEFESLEGGGGAMGGVTIQMAEDLFLFKEGDKNLLSLPTGLTHAPRPLILAPARPLVHHELTLQFIGGSNGFDPTGITTCFLAYCSRDGKSSTTLFDTAAYLRTRLGALGLSPRQLSEVVLSHLHEDHLAGLPELLLMGTRRIRLLTADVIYESLLRLLGAMLDLPQEEVARLFDYYPLNPGEPVTLEGRRFEAIYAVHTIPTIAVRMEGSLCYSGDMRYDEAWFEELLQQGVLSPSRHEELLHFADGVQILVQDAGGEPIHTTITPETLRTLAAKSQRVILAHTSGIQLPPEEAEWAGQIEIARSGHISAVGDEVAENEMMERVETLSACPLFARLPLEERLALAQQVTLRQGKDSEVIIQGGEPVDGRSYVVHSGLAEIWTAGTLLMTVSRGSSLGERGALQGGTRISSVISRGDSQLLELDRELFQPLATRLGLHAALKRANWLWKQALFHDLLWASLLDLALDFQPRLLEQGETIFSLGEAGVECYLLHTGAIRFLGLDGMLLGTLNTPGDFFGGLAAFYHSPRTATAIATMPSEIWTLSAPALHRLQIAHPSLLFHLRTFEATRSSSQPWPHPPLSPEA